MNHPITPLKTLLLPIFLLLLSASLASQTAPEIEGSNIADGPLLFEGKVTGHFVLTNNTSPERDDDTLTYNISLLNNDLQLLGKKEYKTNVALTFEQIAYNGKYLAVMIKVEDDSYDRYLEIFDGAGESIHKINLRSISESYGFILHPVADGFISGVVYSKLKRAADRRLGPSIDFELTKTNIDDRSLDWTHKVSGTTRAYAMLPTVMDRNKNGIAIRVDNRSLKQPRQEELHYFDLNDDSLWITIDNIDRKKNSANTEIEALFIADKTMIAIQRRFKKHVAKYTGGVEVFVYDAAGKTVVSKLIDEQNFLRKAISATKKVPQLSPSAKVTLVGSMADEAGNLTLAFETFDKKNASGERVSGNIYQDAYIVGLSKELEILDVARLEKSHFTLSLKSRSPLTPLEMGAMRRRLRNGKFSRLTQQQRVALNGGPYGFAFAEHGDDYITNYFFDRDFQADGVKYISIIAATFIDGEFEIERIPLENEPDFISLGRAKEGYLKVQDYKLGEGLRETRLERLGF